MARLKQVYRITYPNGKWRVGMDVTGAISYFGSPSNKVLMAAELAEHRLDLTVRKEILWESETATDAEVRAKELDPARGWDARRGHSPIDKSVAAGQSRTSYLGCDRSSFAGRARPALRGTPHRVDHQHVRNTSV
jgi:hypothetical protein